MASDRQLGELILRDSGIKVTEANQKVAKMYAKSELVHNRTFWKSKYDTLIDKDKFTDGERMPLTQVAIQLKTLLKQDAISFNSLDEVLCRLKDYNGKLGILTSIDSTEVFKV